MGQGYTRNIPIDTDPTMSGNSDFIVASQKATKTLIDTEVLLINSNLGNFILKSGDTMTGTLVVPAITISNLLESSGLTRYLVIDESGNTFYQSASTTTIIISGATGPQGPQGVSGATGPQGPPGTGTTMDASNFVLKSGDTMTGDLIVPSLSATSITTVTATTQFLRVNISPLSGSTSDPERVFIYDDSNTFSNLLVGYANSPSYAQLNVRNLSSSSGSSSDIVATADNGNETINYINLGINSSTYSGFIGSLNDGYMYSTGNNLYVGNTTQNKKVGIFVGSSTATTIDIYSGYTNFNKPIYSGDTELVSALRRVFGSTYYRKSGTNSFERWFSTAVFPPNAASTAVLGANNYTFTPLVVTSPITMDRIGINVTTLAAGSLIRLGIYDSLNVVPNNLILDAGTVSATTTGFKTISINQYLPSGLYWLTLVGNAAPTVTAYAAIYSPGVLGLASSGGGVGGSFLTSSLGFNTLTGNVSTATFIVQTAVIPAIEFRLSS